MSKKKKYSKELKQTILKEHDEDGISFYKLGKSSGSTSFLVFPEYFLVVYGNITRQLEGVGSDHPKMMLFVRFVRCTT